MARPPGPDWVTQAEATVPPMVRKAVAREAHFRPMRSATEPKMNCPAMTPTNVMEATKETRCGVISSGYWSLSMANTRFITWRSQPSANMPEPPIRTSRMVAPQSPRRCAAPSSPPTSLVLSVASTGLAISGSMVFCCCMSVSARE